MAIITDDHGTPDCIINQKESKLEYKNNTIDFYKVYR
jgi:hypothetical protein